MANLGQVMLGQWPKNPEEFDPSRFLDLESGEFVNPSPDKFVPFGIGKRCFCIKIILIISVPTVVELFVFIRLCLGHVLAEHEYFLFLAGIMKRQNILK